MQPVIQHPWDVTPDDALEIQKHLAAHVVKEDRLGPVARIAGIDVAYHKDNDTLIATVAVLDATTLEVIEQRALAASPRFRLPETTRYADQHGRQFARQLSVPSSTPT